MLEAARALPYPATKVINAGCGLTVHAALPLGQELHITARVSKIDDNGKRALVTIEVVTGTADVPRALTADLRLFIPLKRAGTAETVTGSDASKPRQKPTVPLDVKELCFQRLGKDAGLDFAFLTGDFNPIHWLSPYAKAAGFKSVILHGFGSFARAFDGLVRAALAGDVQALLALDADFTRPLPLPAEVGLYVGPEQRVYLGDAPGGAAYLVGHFSRHSP
jgi:acyl dehydratase